MAAAPGYPSVPNVSWGSPVTAEAGTLTAPTNTVLCWTPGASGGAIKKIVVRALADTTGVVICRLYISPDGGTTKHLFDEIALQPADGGANAVQAGAEEFYDDTFMQTGLTLYCSTSTNDDLKVTVFGLNL